MYTPVPQRTNYTASNTILNEDQRSKLAAARYRYVNCPRVIRLQGRRRDTRRRGTDLGRIDQYVEIGAQNTPLLFAREPTGT